MIDKDEIIQLLQRQLNESKKEIKELTEQVEELRREIHILEAINLTVRRN